MKQAVTRVEDKEYDLFQEIVANSFWAIKDYTRSLSVNW